MNVDSFIRFENDVRAHGGHKWVGYADGGPIAFQGENSEMKIHRSSKSTSLVSKGQREVESVKVTSVQNAALTSFEEDAGVDMTWSKEDEVRFAKMFAKRGEITYNMWINQTIKSKNKVRKISRQKHHHKFANIHTCGC